MVWGGGDVAGPPRRDAGPQGVPKHIGEHVNLGGQSTSGTPQRLILWPPFSGCGLLVRADNGSVEHQILVVAICGECVEYRSQTPACHQRLKRRCIVLHLPQRSTRSRQCAPDRNNPQTTVREQAVIRSSSARVARLSRQ